MTILPTAEDLRVASALASQGRVMRQQFDLISAAKDALFQEALSHLEVALEKRIIDLDGEPWCSECSETVWDKSEHHEGCPYAAAERFLEEHKS